MSNPRLETYKILSKVQLKGIFSDKLIDQLRKKKDLEKKDFNLVFMLLKGILKMRSNLDYIASQYVQGQNFERTDTKIKLLLNLGFYQLLYCDQIPDHAAINETVELAKQIFNRKVAAFINAVLRSYQKNPRISYPQEKDKYLAYKYSFPVDLIRRWITLWDADSTESLCEFFNQVPHLSIRINTFATERLKLKDYFARRGIKTWESEASPNILLSDQSENVLQDIAFEEGYYSIQDESAAMVVELLKPEPNESVLDLFGGPGGKAAYISELMHNSGELIVIDKFPAKIKKIKQNVERLQITNMKVINEDAFKYGPVAPSFEKVLLDVPCSGWGVLQKKAELRWQTHQNMNELLKLQANALKTGARFVKPGGVLLYSTCTMNNKENEQQIERFLDQHKEFQLMDAINCLPQRYTSNNFLKTIPFLHQMDGAFAAKMKKNNRSSR